MAAVVWFYGTLRPGIFQHEFNLIVLLSQVLLICRTGNTLLLGVTIKIILYDHARRQVVSSHSNKSAVTSIVLTSDKQTIVSSGLDFTLLVWHIVRKSNVTYSLILVYIFIAWKSNFEQCNGVCTWSFNTSTRMRRWSNSWWKSQDF